MTVAPDAVPDQSRVRALVHLAAAPDEREPLVERLTALAEQATTSLDGSVSVRVLAEIPDDPFPAANPGCRPMDAALDLEGPRGVLDAAMAAGVLAGLPAALDGVADLAASGAVVGWPQAVIPGPHCTLRYLYLMRRKAGLARADYLDHYFHRHSAFAFHLNGIRAYTQIHADPEASTALADALGLGHSDIDSVTELSFDSVEEFFAGVTAESAAAGEDELSFVDRDRSVSFCSTDRLIRAADA